MALPTRVGDHFPSVVRECQTVALDFFECLTSASGDLAKRGVTELMLEILTYQSPATARRGNTPVYHSNAIIWRLHDHRSEK